MRANHPLTRLIVACVILSHAACDREAGFVQHDLSLGDGNELPPFDSYDLLCAGFTAQTQLQPVSLVFMLDKSGSMGDGINGDPALKWQPVTQALQAFFEDPASLGVSASLQYFPQADICNSDSYWMQSVDMRPLPDLSFATSMGMVTPGGSTPTLPAMTGAIQYAQDTLAMATAGHVAVVLVTDGDPDTCDSSVNDVALQLSKVAATIPTYVIGVGQDIPSLNQLAQAGGTGSPTLVAVGDPTTTKMQFLAALDAIRGLVLSCSFTIPPAPAGMTIDYNAVNVTFTPSTSSTPQLWPYDPMCTGVGWRYDDPANPKEVILCPAACDEAHSDRTAAIQVLFGCATVVVK